MEHKELVDLVKELLDNSDEIEKLTMSLLDRQIEKGTKDIEKRKQELKDGVDELLDGAFCFMAVSNKGVMITGDKSSIQTCLDVIIQNLIEDGGMSVEDIRKCVESGIKGVNKDE